MASFQFTNDAVKDLSAIWEYTIENWSEKQAEKYYRLLIDTCVELSKKPKLGKDYSDVYPNLRGQKTAKHLIFFRKIDNKTIEITRILHERMDLKSKFKK